MQLIYNNICNTVNDSAFIVIWQLNVSVTLTMHGDPADRLVAATSLNIKLPLITNDRKTSALKTVKPI
jgi:PIN domain nuclease of toxin-antitoxin system